LEGHNITRIGEVRIEYRILVVRAEGEISET
jgi:hypothetical protein